MLAEKWEKPYSEVCGYANAARMSIAIVRPERAIFASVDRVFRRAKCATASRSGREKQVSAFFRHSTSHASLHSHLAARLQRLAHDATVVV
jgi:hypothetical protein